MKRVVRALSIDANDTYWYFTGIPELMAIAGERFHRYAEGAST
ncbi:hypothetical protein [Burkholderia stagnalis]|nr:hypothetical protein [Burkholderia stagnalis]